MLNWSGEKTTKGGNPMPKVLSSAILAIFLVAATAPAFAADAPKTKTECEKLKDMKWDDAKKACVKK
jgi:hypothetical protein